MVTALLRRKRYHTGEQSTIKNCTAIRPKETQTYYKARNRPTMMIFPILQEVEEATKALKTGKAACFDNISTELIQQGGGTVTCILYNTCTKICQTGEWPTSWTKSLIITLPKKGNLQLCQNYRTISAIYSYAKIIGRSA